MDLPKSVLPYSYSYSARAMELDGPLGITPTQAGAALDDRPMGALLSSDGALHHVEHGDNAQPAVYCDDVDDAVETDTALHTVRPTMLYARFLALSKTVPRGAQDAVNILFDLDQRDVAHAIVAVCNAANSGGHWKQAMRAIGQCDKAWQPALFRLLAKQADVFELHHVMPLQKEWDPLLRVVWSHYDRMPPGEPRYAGLGDLVLARADFERFPSYPPVLLAIVQHCQSGLPIAYWARLLEGFLEHEAQSEPFESTLQPFISAYLRAYRGRLPALPTSVRSLLAQASYRLEPCNVRAMWQNVYGVSDAVLRADWDPIMASVIAKEEMDSFHWTALRPHHRLKRSRDPYPLSVFPQALDALHRMPSEKRDLPMQARCYRWSPGDAVFLEMTKLRHLDRVEKHLREDFFYLIPPHGDSRFMADMSTRIKQVIVRVEHETLDALRDDVRGQRMFLAWLDDTSPPTTTVMWNALIRGAQKMPWQAQPRLLERLSQPLDTLRFRKASIQGMSETITSWRDSIVSTCRVNKAMHLAAYAFEGTLRTLIELENRSGDAIQLPIAGEMTRILSELPTCYLATLLSQLQEYAQKSANKWPISIGEDALYEAVNLLLRDPKSTAASLSPDFQRTLISQAGLIWQALPDHPPGGREKVTAFATRFGIARPGSDAVLRQVVEALMAPVIKCEASMDTVLSNAGLNDGLARRYADEFLWWQCIKPALERWGDMHREIANYTDYPDNLVSMYKA